MSDFDTKIAAIAAKQHSLITLGDVKSLKGTKRHASTRCSAGRWDSVAHELYRLAGVPWTYEARVMALVLAAGDGACASHFCALRLHGLQHPTAPPEISTLYKRRYRNTNALVRRSRDLDLITPFVIEGLPVTPVDRTLLDSAALLKGHGLKSVVEQAVRNKQTTWSALLECIALHARQGRPGVSALRDLVTEAMEKDSITETDSERVALSLIRQYGLGDPTLQHKIFADGGRRFVAKMDFAYVALKLNIEVDGKVHLLPKVRLKDELRDDELHRAYGWTVRRIWWEIPVYKPRLFASIVRQEIADAEARLAAA